LRIEGQQVGADLVIGLDQYDLEKASQQIEWRKILNLENVGWTPEISSFAQRFTFLAYDWGVLSMVLRKSENRQPPQVLEDYLATEYKAKISLPDPRTSTPGLEFLLWLIQLKGEEGAFQFLKKLEPQILAYSPNWSTAYGLFSHGEAKVAFSYTTSPLYHLLEEKNSDIIAVEQKEPHPIQVEYFGIPSTCHSCDLAQKLAQFLLSAEGQKIIMERNYMLPVIPGVKEKTPFATIPQFQVLNSNVIPGSAERERILKRWVDLRESN
jgi:thiamine transport system substrate-binding protein